MTEAITRYEDDETEGGGFKRLGKRDLGRYAFEECMPDRVKSLVQNEGGSNRFEQCIPKLALLLRQDSEVVEAHLCTQSAIQICKIVGEGHHFCGYRNVQMLLLALKSTLDGARTQYSIPQIQDMVEDAWDRGYNPHGRILTGGVKNTRKHIGTSEAEAVLLSLGIPCTGSAFRGVNAHTELFDFVETYFTSGSRGEKGAHETDRPPIFLQKPRHSVTIVGFERTKSGKRRLLTFDPAYQIPTVMKQPLQEFKYSKLAAHLALWRYRKSETSLKIDRAYETLTVDT